MTDYKEKLDDLQRAAKRKAHELDEKFGVSDKVEDTARAAGDAARRGARTIADGAGQLKGQAERFADDPKVRETARRAADETKRRAKDAGRTTSHKSSTAKPCRCNRRRWRAFRPQKPILPGRRDLAEV